MQRTGKDRVAAWLPTTLRARLVVLALLATLPAITVEVVGLVSSLEQGRNEATAELRTHAEQIVHELDEARIVAHQLLRSISFLPELSGADPGACSDLLYRLVVGGGVFRNIGVATAEGKVVCAGIPSKEPLNLRGRSYFERALKTWEFGAGDFQTGLVTRQGAINFALPVIDDNAAAGLILYANLLLRDFVRSPHHRSLPAGSRITLLDPHFVVVERMPPDDWVGKSIAGTALHGLIVREPSLSGVIDGLGGDRRFQVVAPARLETGEIQGYVTVSIPEASWRARSARGVLHEVLALAVLLVTVLMIAWWAGEALVLRRLRPLLATIRRVGSGDFAARAGAGKDNSEFSVLENAFNDMAQRIEYDLQRISRLNRTYAVLSDINGTIVRVRKPQVLLDEVCRIAVNTGGFLAACVYLVEAGTKEARLAAHAGAGLAHFSTLLPRLDEPVSVMNGPVVNSLKTGEPAIEPDLAAADKGPWKARILAFGTRSMAAFPLVLGGETRGTLALYSGAAHVFDEEEVRLFLELAADTSLGLEIAQKESQLYQLSNFDLVTGLPNRSLFQDRITQALARTSRTKGHAAVLLLRIGRFRQINDRFGWAGCDAVVKHVAHYLNGVVRPGDTLSRMADDTFGVLLADVRRVDDIVATVDRVIGAFPRSMSVRQDEVLLNASVGVAIFPGDGETAEALLHNAQITLDSITSHRGNALAFYAAEVDERAQARHLMETQLAHAIERGELALVYQPVMRLADRTVAGAEALLRWRNAVLGEVSPAQFIPVAEQSGLIRALGNWVFRTACAQRAAWADSLGNAFRLSANVSVHQLRDADFAANAREIFAATGLDPGRASFGIEITETELMEQIDRVVPMLDHLRACAVYISVDDFGTGYSSLNYLWRLPIHALKIDVSFVRNMVTDRNARAVVGSVIALAHSVELQVVAEGIETEAQLEALIAMGCDFGQGYLFSRPLAPPDFEAFVARNGVAR